MYNGVIEFSPPHFSKKHQAQESWKKVAILKTNDDLDCYYAWFLKKRFNLVLNPSGRGSHITFVCEPVNDEIFEKFKLLYNNIDANFSIDLEPRSNGSHWWLKAYSKDLEFIRESMGLPTSRKVGLHLTLGFANDLQIEFSNYILNTIKFHNV